MHGHPFAKGGHFLWELLAFVLSQLGNPVLERRSRGLIEALDLLVAELSGAGQWRKPSPVQDLVRIRIPDAAEETGIGQGALQGVAL